MLMFVTFGPSPSGVLNNAAEGNPTTMTWIGLMLLLAACGKSAQFVAVMVARRDGRSDACLGVHPRGNHADRGRKILIVRKRANIRRDTDSENSRRDRRVLSR